MPSEDLVFKVALLLPSKFDISIPVAPNFDSSKLSIPDLF